MVPSYKDGQEAQTMSQTLAWQLVTSEETLEVPILVQGDRSALWLGDTALLAGPDAHAMARSSPTG